MASSAPTAAPAPARPPFPPFTRETAEKKVKAAQDAWNTKNPSIVAPAYTEDCIWRNRDAFFQGHAAIVQFLEGKWSRESGYRLRKELFAFTDDRIAVQFWYEYFVEGEDGKGDGTGDGKGKGGEKQWYRCYGLEDWTFAADGRMRKRMMSGNDVAIAEDERWFRDGVDVNTVPISEKHW
ncbi:uncharacterized protein SPSK_06637 [Sporothrix schenckii 1099-18]|uniref:DUF4440 domain-containing protein n=2 Tax=Sporothrix schenckii TaxID=29908 RepID=U7PTH1_SPOS1|nr:uncharacterized protein SPSK_06637 [Sporothrix schenckii 1099-18]ERS98256.1 hypothetical protein HMPREF1624_05039 [Sporothrix schenckii ATCC 58251]KJR89636.1 hypothetical protein SPSK_06637 [Sporothrix schenckii 1099-18]